TDVITSRARIDTGAINGVITFRARIDTGAMNGVITDPSVGDAFMRPWCLRSYHRVNHGRHYVPHAH
ncbi:hypothetical protein, partial [Pantoea sp. UBA4549]|uniref:hypothetical protein n=1 Tax=Pantoea sp. UBA4549 TaxID=1947033 RepID=UPI0025F2A9D7